jgi:chromosome segregation ATPase
MASLFDLVLAPPRLVVRAFDDLNRIAHAAEDITKRLDPLEDDIDGLRRAFEGSNEQLCKHREAVTPELIALRGELVALRAQVGGQIAEMEDDLSGVRDTVEPLQGAAERVGRAVERLPGRGRRRR